MNKNDLLAMAITSLLATGSTLSSPHAEAIETPSWAGEKCYGVALAGKNDCGNEAFECLDPQTEKHDCAGHAKVDFDTCEWIFTPEGLCEKLGGHATSLNQ